MNRSHDFTGELPDDSIDAQAAAWFARNRQDQQPAERQAFESWLREPAHASAYRSFDVLWTDLG